jgi:adenylate cyclase
MGVEIERKFRVMNDDWRAAVQREEWLRQGYMASSPQVSIRVRTDGRQGYLNIKGATLGVERAEYDYPIPANEADELLDTLCDRPLIEKTRYHLEYAGYHWEVDVFAGDNAGLVVAEIELPAVDAPFARPPWVGAEVSDDPRYYNVSLVHHPYKDWERD